ncbi:hypothetical protein T484DRAFT_1807870 [Baffinella frigidus]|nr:hypothetical protein T484DRAFT_1807870 [Cryptophyta sp. CCMP2293]
MSFHRPALAAALLLCIARPQLAGEPPLASITHVSSRCVSPWHASLKAHASIAESEEEGGALRRARSSTCRAPLSLRVRGGGVGGGDSAGESSGEFDPATLKIEDLADSDYWEEIGETARDSLRKVGRGGSEFLAGSSVGWTAFCSQPAVK